ncbi:hypothetical protein [Microcella sp.]|uniref:hypothetical protein n=1 Tax=Microcella sp. TaxID=1913979 RepID=UPI003F717447
MNPEFSQTRSDAIRAGLEHAVSVHTPDSVRRVPGWITGASLLIVGLVTGGAVSAAAVTGLQGVVSLVGPTNIAIEAPPGVLPGVPIISLLGETESYEITGEATVDLSAPPDGATHVRATISCLTVGSFNWGIDPTGNNPSIYCGAEDVTSGSGSASMDFPLDTGTQRIFAQTGPQGRALLVVQYVNYVPTALGRNASGETYGVAWTGLEPDLVAVDGIAPDGSSFVGYARATDLDAFGPDWPGQPSSPEEALEWQRERDERYPDGWEIPVYSSDGRTVLGRFLVSN